ncbi:MAG TPA: sigma 54-interacting transcriptional regulator, partial [Chloroflexota bacterium]|nr:sigma 54-interacting transcriptional regulator [Chloroflexota bacterium]
TALPPVTDEPTPRIEEALIRAARSLTAHLDVDGVCHAVLDAVGDVFGARCSWILLYHAGTKQLRTACSRGHGSEAFHDLAISPDTGILGLAFKGKRVVFVPNVQDDDRWFDPPRVHAAGLESVFTIPLVYGDEVLGVVGLDSPRFTADRPPAEAHIARLEALAAQAAIAIANARLYEASEEDRRRLRALLHEQNRLRGHVTHLEEHIRITGAFREIVGESTTLRAAVNQAALAAPGDTTILLLGETGSGKELLARFIHERSSRSKGPFVPVNCAALPEALVESELFGHEKGAFTGAIARKPGKFEIANRGTVLLDEIGDLPKEAQAKLLRVLQDREVHRVGSTHPVAVDVRVIAATNQDLEGAVEAHSFREDLYYRLNVFPIRVPPIRQRRDDIPALAHHFVTHFATKLRKRVNGLAPGAIRRLQEYDWPGNIRELQNVIERAVVLTQGAVVESEAIMILSSSHAHPSTKQSDVLTLADAERSAIVAALEAAHWRISGPGGAADRLGLKPTTLHAKMKKLGVHRSIDRDRSAR